MKLTSFLTENRSAYGIVTDSGVIDLSRLSQTPDNLCSALTDPGAEQLALLGAGLAPAVADLDPGARAVLLDAIDQRFHAGHLTVMPEAQAAIGNTAFAVDGSLLDHDQRGTAHRNLVVVKAMEVVHLAFIRDVHGHRRHHDPVLQFEITQPEGGENARGGRHLEGVLSEASAWQIAHGGMAAEILFGDAHRAIKGLASVPGPAGVEQHAAADGNQVGIATQKHVVGHFRLR